ncbi:MAG: Mrp/NBP35 family ATP-binding protein [Bacteroidales bacterium]|nr:Mrp/NBP35 family ATP-binding protein [Bacteroidales bacterium]
MTSEKDIISILEEIVHPSLKQNIVALGMVKSIQIEDNKIHIILVYPKPTDPFANAIKKACIRAITEKTKQDYTVEIEEIFSTARKVSPEYDNLKDVKNIIAVASGKGGVGKSTVAVNLAIALSHLNLKVGLLDADLYGPSVPKMFAAEHHQPTMVERNGKELIEPLIKYNIKVQSAGFFFNPNEALIWRGPMATNALKQMITQTLWEDLDYLLIDLPPGTGDIHITLVQELPITGAVIVSTPQKVALADVIKGISMFRSDKINVPVLGIVENMSWFTPAELPENKYYIFGKEGCKQLAEELNVPLLGQIPIVQSICESGDTGQPVAMNPFTLEGKAFANLAENVIVEVDKRNNQLPPTKKVEITHR